MAPAPPIRLAPRRLARIRSRLQEIGYTHDRLVERLGIVYESYHPDNRGNVEAVEAHLHREPADALDVLIRLFFLSEPVELKALESYLEIEDLALFEDAGLLRRASPTAMAAGLSLFECHGLYLVTDSLMRRRAEAYNVAALLPECYDLAAATLRRPSSRTLDLCTGSGVHALLAARHSGEVVGVDANPRAVRFADFNKALNGAANVTFSEGDLYEPLAGERFELVVSIPPYIPDLKHEPGENYYSAGADGEAVSSRIFAGLDAHLAEGGFCQLFLVMIDWPGNLFRKRFVRYLGESIDRFRAVVLAREIDFKNPAVTGEERVTYGLLTIKKELNAGGELIEGPLENLSGTSLTELLMNKRRTDKKEKDGP